MKRPDRRSKRRVLTVDVGGTHVKFEVSGNSVAGNFVLGSVDPQNHGIAVAVDTSRELALHMKAEIQRIIKQLSEPYAP